MNDVLWVRSEPPGLKEQLRQGLFLETLPICDFHFNAISPRQINRRRKTGALSTFAAQRHLVGLVTLSRMLLGLEFGTKCLRVYTSNNMCLSSKIYTGSGRVERYQEIFRRDGVAVASHKTLVFARWAFQQPPTSRSSYAGPGAFLPQSFLVVSIFVSLCRRSRDTAQHPDHSFSTALG